jgi:ABC-type branched-subunit amino acid transport system substrate-binding protein
MASAGRGWLRRSVRSVFLTACLGLAGCQASNLGDGLSASNSGVAALGSSTYGNGPVQVTMLLPTDAALRRKAADIADGAKLALDDLGAGQLRIDFQASASTSGQAASKVQAASAAGSKLIIGPATNGEVSRIISGTSQPRPPILALVANNSAGGTHIWPLYGDAIDSALEGVGVAVAAKQKNIVVVHEAGFPAENLLRLREGIKLKGGNTIGFVPYPASGINLRAAFAKGQLVFAKANTIVLLGGGDAIGEVIDILAAGEFGQSIATAIATSLIPEEIYKRPSAQGLMVAVPSTTDVSVIAERFKAKYGRAPSYDAAIGYDSIAIAAGLVRSAGPDAITVENLTSTQGFRAATGLFRFRPDGRIERRMIVHRIENGSLNVIQEEGEGF